MPRIQGLSEGYLTNSQTIRATGEAYVFSITIAFNNVTAGQRCYLRNGDGTQIRALFVFGAANGMITREWTQGKYFPDGLTWDAGAGDAGDNVFVELTYK